MKVRLTKTRGPAMNIQMAPIFTCSKFQSCRKITRGLSLFAGNLTPWNFGTQELKYVHGMKLMLMTATPMYNNYIEIVFLLNLLLLNDKKARLQSTDIFDGTGWKKNREGKEIGREILGQVAGAYVSFMRGENPLKFPIRLMPL